MKESSHLRSDAPIHIIYKRIQDASLPALRDNVIICNYCWNQSAIALFQKNLFTSASHSDSAITLNAHGDNKTIVFAKITMEGL